MDYNFLTSENEELLKNKDYNAIVSVLNRMARSGAIALGTGFCTSMADMVKTALSHRNIKSKIVECQLTLTYFECDPPEISFVGFTDLVNPGEIDTHVVVVTETDPPFLIDASIKHRLPPNNIAIVEPIKKNFTDPFNLVDTKFDNINLTVSYYQKKVQSFALSHNDSIVERMETDKKVFKSLFILKILISIALTIGVINGIRGGYDFYQIYINENYWGPASGKIIDQRLDRLEELLKLPLEERNEKFDKNNS
jgi:hypothetical protein